MPIGIVRGHFYISLVSVILKSIQVATLGHAVPLLLVSPLLNADGEIVYTIIYIAFLRAGITF